jgi:FkbM family methyltransferase
VICVEPNPLNVGLISHNLKKFLSNGQITLIDKALSHNDQGTVLNVPTEVEVFGGMGATTQVRARSVERKSRQVEVGSIELNKLLEKEVCLLKCDIEGAEFDTLIAAGANIRNCKNIIVEIHTDVCDFNEKFMKLLSHLTLNSFQIFCYEGVNNPCSFHEKGISPSFLLFAKNQKMQ